MTSYLRYKQELKCVQDADDTDIESWITVRGNHIPIKKGQSKEEAVKSFVEHQAGKNDIPQGVKWTPTNKKGEGTGNKKTEEKPKYNIQHGAKISDIESMINKHADKKGYKSWKEEEEYVAEKLKEEGIYAYGNQIKEAMKNVYGDAYTQERKEESKYDPEFETVRKNALANGNVYGGKYTQKSKAEAYKEYKKDTAPKMRISLPEGKEGKDIIDRVLKDFRKNYDKLYKDNKLDSQYSDLVTKFDKDMQESPEFKEFVQKTVKQRGDAFSSDREVKALMLAANEYGLVVDNKKEVKKPESKPKSSGKTTFYKNVSGKELWSPAWKGSGRKSGYTAIENELLTEKEMEKHGFNKESSAFKKVELGKKDHHYMFGARFETKKGDK